MAAICPIDRYVTFGLSTFLLVRVGEALYLWVGYTLLTCPHNSMPVVATHICGGALYSPFMVGLDVVAVTQVYYTFGVKVPMSAMRHVCGNPLLSLLEF